MKSSIINYTTVPKGESALIYNCELIGFCNETICVYWQNPRYLDLVGQLFVYSFSFPISNLQLCKYARFTGDLLKFIKLPNAYICYGIDKRILKHIVWELSERYLV